MGRHNQRRYAGSQAPQQRPRGGARLVWHDHPVPRFLMMRFVLRASTPHWAIVAWRVVQLVVVLALGVYIGMTLPLKG
jgi:hypothetical protein